MKKLKMANGKVCITFMSPNAVWSGLEDAGFPANDVGEMPEVRAAIEKFIEHMECVTIEIDLDTAEAIVLPVKVG